VSLDGRHGIVADAIDWKEDAVGAADQAGDQPRAMLDSTVMMKEPAAGALGHSLELGNLVSPAADVQ
jgi:hypothetical protein